MSKMATAFTGGNDLFEELANVIDIAHLHVHGQKYELSKKIDVSKISQAYANGQEPDYESSLYMDLDLAEECMNDALYMLYTLKEMFQGKPGVIQ
ncbi:hypothetical protein [Acetobacterium bakii]|uniref:Uncharacterized protein n=1 Tax=Acetobacterium bakii TaxID=52689 RepID=A0A0L6TYW2_9FIRM|nr:hypothetical protein [Acetobacterium bakii]KNZ41451.1 hypothetical protein AKG39_11825 [Acetobacterium bakii]